MPQFLKEEIKEKIIDSAVKEFIDKGYEHASMRNIAKRSGITVGNIYRYFDSKENILIKIVEPVLLKLDIFMKNITNNALNLNKLPSNNESLLFVGEGIHSLTLLTAFSEFIIKLFKQYKNEIIILLTNEEVLSKYNYDINLNSWLIELFRVKFKFEMNKKELDEEDKIYINAIEKGFVAGIVEIAKNCESALNLQEILERYIRFYF